MKVIFVFIFALASVNAEVIVAEKPVNQGSISDAKPIERKLEVDSSNMNSGYYMNKLLQTHNLSNMALLQSQRQEELTVFDKSFKNIDGKIDEFRDTIAQKLLELKNSLERPKAPVMGMGNMMTNLFNTDPFANSDLTRMKQRKNNVSLANLNNDFQKSISKIQNAENSLMSLSGKQPSQQGSSGTKERKLAKEKNKKTNKLV